MAQWSGDPRVKPPYGAVEINWDHPLAKGLTGCWLFNERGGGPIDLVHHVGSTLSGPTWGKGPGLHFTAASSQWADAGSAVPANAGPGSIVLRLFPTSVGGGYYMPVSRNAGTGQDWEIQITQTTGRIGLDYNGGTSIETATALTVNQQADLCFVLGVTDIGEFAYLNGRLDKSSFVGVSWRNGNGAIEFGRRASSTYYYDGDILHCLLYNRRLVAAEVLESAVAPYAFLRPIVRRRYFIAAAPAGPTTIEADGAAAGVATGAAVSGATKGSAGASAGATTADAASQTVAAVGGDGAAAGVGAAAAVALWFWATRGTGAGGSTTLGVGQTVSAIGSDGIAAGVGLVTGVSGATAGSAGAADGVATVLGRGEDAAVGSVSGMMWRHHAYGL